MNTIEEITNEQTEWLEEIRVYVEDQALREELHEVEENLLHRVLRLGLLLLQEVIIRHGSGDEGKFHNHGGVTRSRHSEKTRSYLSIFGPVEIKRTYYWEEDEGGYCPLDEKLNLPERWVSYLLQGWVQERAVKESFDDAIEDVEQFLNLRLPKRTHEQITHEASEYVPTFYEEKKPPESETEGRFIGVEADGKGIRMIPSDQPKKTEEETKPRRGKGEKPGLRRMAVATADFTFEPEARTAEEMVAILMKEETTKTQENDSKRRGCKSDRKNPRMPVNTRIAGTLTGKETAIKELAGRVHQRDPTGEKTIIVLVDGEKSLETQIRSVFRKEKLLARVDAFILDIMHAMEYLWEAGTVLLGEKNKDRNPWVRRQALAVLQGRVGYVIGGLKRICTCRKLTKTQERGLQKTITYFANHKHMMRYNEYLQKGYPIGTGLIEGTCRSLVKDRMDISGAKWTQAGAEAILRLRSVKKNSDWNAYWDYYISKSKERLYGISLN